MDSSASGREVSESKGLRPVSDTELDLLLLQALAVPEPMSDFQERLERHVLAHAVPRRSSAPRGWMWLIPLGLAGMALSSIWLLLAVGVPVESLLSGLLAGLAALLTLPATLFMPVAWIAAVIVLTLLNGVMLASGRQLKRSSTTHP